MNTLKQLRKNPITHFKKWASYKGEQWWGYNASGKVMYTQLSTNDDMWRVLKVWQGLGLIYMINTPITYIHPRYKMSTMTGNIIHSRHPVSVMLTEYGEEISKDTWVFYKL